MLVRDAERRKKEASKLHVGQTNKVKQHKTAESGGTQYMLVRDAERRKKEEGRKEQGRKKQASYM